MHLSVVVAMAGVGKERRLRSAIDYIHYVRAPTFYFEGADEGYMKDARKMEKWTQNAGAPVSVFAIKDGDHFDIVEPICKMLARKIAADTGAACSISVNQAEAQKAYESEIDE